MRYLTKENIILCLVIVLIFGQGIDLFNVDDSNWKLKEAIYIKKLKESDKIIKQARDSVNQIRTENEVIKEHVTADSVVVWNADRRERDSLRSIINPR